MKVLKVQFYPWDKPIIVDAQGLDFKKGAVVVFRHEGSNELGEVVGFAEVDIEQYNKEQGNLRSVSRAASTTDLQAELDDEQKSEMISEARKLVHEYNLEMKVVDVHQSLDGSRVTFAFIADGRVDFRDLVKELTKKYSRTIRLQQIGIRDEARLCGDCGHCGRTLCCKGHVKDFMSITSEMAEAQQCEHRGSERISGCCGRLMCCLSYEEKGYKESSKDFPPIGSIVNVDGRRGEVINWKVLKRCVLVKFPDEGGGRGYSLVDVDLDRNKKK
ncbi:MAG: regulatory iron-sulfur-containing complex subunit RicT [bacterium]